MAIIRKIIHYISNVIYILIFAYALICIPMLFKYKPLVVLTGSMEPTFKVGSIIYYKAVSENELKKGDIITFETDSGKMITHRINAIDNGRYETKGDANNSVDPLKITYKNIKGRDANISIPYVGYFVKFVNENLMLVMIPTIIILISEFLFSNFGNFDIKKKEKKKEEGEEII